MGSTQTVVGAAAVKKVLAGVNKVLEVVAPTLGPAGRSVLLSRTYNRGPRLADDGYLAAESVQLKDPHENLAAEYFKEGIKKTNTLAGDGTTGTAVLSAHLINQELKDKSFGDVAMPTVGGASKEDRSARAIRKQMLDAKDVVIAEIKKRVKPVETLEELEQISFVSLGKEDLETAKIVAKVVWEVARDVEGKYLDNHIEILEGYKGEIETEITHGMRFPAKVAARAFVNKPERHEMVLEDVPVLVTNYKMDNPKIFLDIFNQCKVTKIAVFSPDFSLAMLQYMADCTKKGAHMYPVKVPALRTVQLEDLAVYTAATVIDKDSGMKLEATQAWHLGFAEKIVVKDTENRDDAVVLGGKGEKIGSVTGNAITERVKVLKGQLGEVRNELERIQLEKRIANLGSAVGVLRVGSITSGDGLFMKLKVEDAVYACKGALEEGYVRGGGLCLKEIAESLPESVLTEALKAPAAQLQLNAGGSFAIDEDVIDPAKVVRLIVEHAVSIAATLITMHSIVAEMPDTTEGEGLEKVARALSVFAYYQAKHESMLQENENEAELDRMRSWENVMMGADR